MTKEIVDWVDKKRIYTQTGPRKEIPKGQEISEYKQSVHTWIINDEGKFLMQKRAATKKHFPNKWSQTGGGIMHNETSIDAVIRECYEELGINVNPEYLELKLSFQREFDYVDVYILYQDINIADIVYQESEVSDAKYFTKEEIEDMIKNDELAPSVAAYFGMLLLCIDKTFDTHYIKVLKRPQKNSI